MYLENISLTNFKNYEFADLSFIDGINCLVGTNGSGKTNVLDAIYACSITKSYFQKREQKLLLPDSQFFIVKAHYSNENNVLFGLQGKKKTFKFNNVEYEKNSEHIGKIPLVFTTPYDTDIIRDSKEIRRKFFDNILSQLDQDYLKSLIHLNKLLKSRNALLKQFKENSFQDIALLDTYDQQLAPLNIYISQKRRNLINEFEPIFTKHYHFLTEGKERVKIQYQTNVFDNFLEETKNNHRKDLITTRTSIGTHKDDFALFIEDDYVKQIGSQGQQKSFILALQLAKFSVFKKHFNQKPFLLLDDIFDKLDEKRISKLISMMSSGEFGQVFITDASPRRVQELTKSINADVKIIEIEKGQIIKQ